MPVFWILIVIGLIALWIFICTVLYPLGKIIYLLINKELKNLENNKNEEYDER